MITREQKIRVGIFFLIGLFLMTSLLVAVLGKALFKKESLYHIRFRDVSVNGLEVGSTVKYRGINVGTVRAIKVSDKDISDIIVTLALGEDAQVKKDMKANLIMMGITGMKQIELYGGTNISEPLEPGSFIPAGSSALADITGDAQIITDKVELLLNNLNGFARKENQEAFTGILNKINYLLDENADEIEQILRNAAAVSEDLRISSAEVKDLTESGRLRELTTKMINLTENLNKTTTGWSKALPPERISAISRNMEEFTQNLQESQATALIAETEEAIREMKEILQNASKTSETVDMAVLRSSRDLVGAIETLDETLENLNEFSRVISDDPSRLINF